MQKNILFNGGCHVLILLTFLTVLFFTYISKQTQSHINEALDNVIQKKVPQLLQQVGQYSLDIPWTLLDDELKNLKEYYQTHPRANNNSLLLRHVVVVIIILTLVLFLFTYWYKDEIDVGKIVTENAVIFFVVAIIEIWFFQNIVSQFVPVLPSQMEQAVYERIIYQLNK